MLIAFIENVKGIEKLPFLLNVHETQTFQFSVCLPFYKYWKLLSYCYNLQKEELYVIVT